MLRSHLFLTVLFSVAVNVLSGNVLAAQGAQTSADDQTPAVQQTAAKIDALFAAAWQAENVTPTDTAGDAEYLRRVSLDLAGRIPAVSELREFLSDESPHKRAEVVERMLDSPASVRNFTTVWRNALIPQANDQPQFRGVIPGFEAWLWEHFSRGTPYNQIVREIITAELNASAGPALFATTSPDAFFAVRELKPENLASGTARAFLGVRLDCAQCHDHPFDQWSQTQFWNMAAFYSGFAREEDEDEPANMMAIMQEDRERRTIAIPGTDEIVPAVFLTGTAPDWSRDAAASPREALADWIVDDNNPYFARMAVNRLWNQFFGRGIVDPVDDFSENNPPSHPAVLDLLAEEFINSGYDYRHVVRIITATRVYQLSSEQTDESQADPIHFARSALRGLTPEQLFDSLAEATGFYQPFRSENPFVIDMDTPRARFVDLFRDAAESSMDRETTILQALAMMNGEFIGNATSLEESRTLRAVVEFPVTDAEKLETLFLAALSRQPTAREYETLTAYVRSGGATDDTDAALTDVFWALLNSSEFLLNH